MTCEHYQNEDEPHAFSSHAVNQGGQVFKLWVQDKVELTIHVVNVCVLHILQDMPDKTQVGLSLFYYNYQNKTEM